MKITKNKSKKRRDEVCRRTGVNYKTAVSFLEQNDWDVNKTVTEILKITTEVQKRTGTTQVVAIRFLGNNKWDIDKSVNKIKLSVKRISKAINRSEEVSLKLLATRAGNEKRTIRDALKTIRQMEEDKQKGQKTNSQQKIGETKNKKSTQNKSINQQLTISSRKPLSAENSADHNQTRLPIITYYPKQKKESGQSIDFKDFMVRSNTVSCQKKGHKISEVNARIAVLRRNGAVIEMMVAAARCEECNRYYISSGEFDHIREKGVPLCRLIQNEKKDSHTNSYYADFNDESILHMYGYNVSEASNLSDQQRHALLVLLVEAKVRNRYQICQHLDWLIKSREGYKKDYSSAISKWKNDRSFIASYELTDAEEVAIKSILY